MIVFICKYVFWDFLSLFLIILHLRILLFKKKYSCSLIVFFSSFVNLSYMKGIQTFRRHLIFKHRCLYELVMFWRKTNTYKTLYFQTFNLCYFEKKVSDYFFQSLFDVLMNSAIIPCFRWVPSLLLYHAFLLSLALVPNMEKVNFNIYFTLLIFKKNCLIIVFL